MFSDYLIIYATWHIINFYCTLIVHVSADTKQNKNNLKLLVNTVLLCLGRPSTIIINN